MRPKKDLGLKVIQGLITPSARNRGWFLAGLSAGYFAVGCLAYSNCLGACGR